MSVLSRSTRLLVVAGTLALTGTFTGCTSNAGGLTPPGEPVVVPRASRAITVDGDIDDWSTAITIRIARTDPPPEGARTKVAFCWDDAFLYVAFVVSDLDLTSSANERDARNVRDDGVMLLIDTHGDRTREWQGDDIFYSVNLTGSVTDARGLHDKSPNVTWDGGMKHAVSLAGTLNRSDDADTGYTVEMAVPWDDIGVVRPTADATSLGLNVVIFTRGRNEEDFGSYDWTKGPGLLRPDTFGTIRLSK